MDPQPIPTPPPSPTTNPPQPDNSAGLTNPPTDPLAQSKFKSAKRKAPAALAVVLGGVLLLTSMAVAYFALYLPNQPSVILRDAVLNTLNTTSVAIDGGYTIENEGESQEIISFSAQTSEEASLLSINVDWADTLSGNAELMVNEQALFLRLDVGDIVKSFLPAVSLPAQTVKDITAVFTDLADQWIKVDSQDLQGASLIADESVVPQEDIDTIMNAAKNHIFVVVKERLPDEDINGQPSHHFKLAFDRSEYAEFLEAIKNAELSSLPVSDALIDNAKGSATANDDETFDIWISKDDRLITRIALMSDGAAASSGVLRLDFSDYNVPVTFEEPAEAVSFETIVLRYQDLLGKLFSGTSLAGSQVSARDSERRLDLTLVKNAIEVFEDENDRVPTVKELSSDKWVRENMPALSIASLKDPQGGRYLYVALNSDEEPCGNRAATCEEFEISADLESDGRGARDSDRNTKDVVVTN